MAGGEIVGLRNYFFFDEKDKEYSLDAEVPLSAWNTDYITTRMQEIIKEGNYDFVFTMMPSPRTHAHHKASAILALRAVKKMEPQNKPLVLASTIVRDMSDSTGFSGLEGYSITNINADVEPFTFDRSQKFGHNNELDYNMIANWVIAEHKSQGTMQQFMGADSAIEQYRYYEINPADKVQKVRKFFDAVRKAKVYSDPNGIDENRSRK